MKFYDLPLFDQLRYLATSAGITEEPISNTERYPQHPFQNIVVVVSGKRNKRMSNFYNYNDGYTTLVFYPEGPQNPSSVSVSLNRNSEANYNNVVSRLGLVNQITMTGNAKEVLDKLITIYNALSEYDDIIKKSVEKLQIMREQLNAAEKMTKDDLESIDANSEGQRTLSYFLQEFQSYHNNRIYLQPYDDVKKDENEDGLTFKSIYDGGQSTLYIFDVSDTTVGINLQKNIRNEKQLDICLYTETERGDRTFQVIGSYDLSRKDSSYRVFSKNFVPYAKDVINNNPILANHPNLRDVVIERIETVLAKLPEKAPLYDYCQCDDDDD